MKPEEKANKLCMRFLIQTTTDIPYAINKTIAKQCALIAVDEIFKTGLLEGSTLGINKKYWQEVKIEIEKL
jgi:hypothetical protein